MGHISIIYQLVWGGIGKKEAHMGDVSITYQLVWGSNGRKDVYMGTLALRISQYGEV